MCVCVCVCVGGGGGGGLWWYMREGWGGVFEAERNSSIK